MSTPRALRPLRNPAYRWLAAALVSSMIGSGIWMVALVWQIVAIGGGAAELSLVAGASAIGMLLTTLLGGALADRMSQKRILFVVEVVRAASVGIVAMLSLSGGLAAWQLAVVAFIGGVMAGLYYPAYSALLPSVLPEDQLLAANGFEGMARPILMQAGGPALASALIAVSSPGAALAVTALTGVVAAVCILKVPDVPLRGERPVAEQTGGTRHPAVALLVDVREGFVYMVRTPWLLGTLTFASLLIFLIMGPFEVLVPFVIKDVAGGGPERPRTHPGGVRHRRCGRVGGHRLAPDAAALPDRDEPALGVRMPPARGVRPDRPDLGHGDRGVPRGRGVQRRRRDLGHAAAAPGARGDARPGLEPRLLRLARVHADLDGDRRAGGGVAGAAGRVPHRGARAAGDRRGRDHRGANAARRDRAPARRERGRARRGAAVAASDFATDPDRSRSLAGELVSSVA